MGGGGFGGARMTTGLDDNDRLHARCRTRRRHETLRVADRLDIEQDRARLGLQREIIEQVAKVDVGHVTHRHQAGEANAPLMRPRQQRRRNRARLRNDRQIAWNGRMRGETRIELRARHDHAEAVGPDNADAGFGGDLRKFGFQRPVAMRGIGGDDDCRADAECLRLAHDLRHRVTRCRDDHEIGRCREIGDARHTGRALDALVAWIDEEDGPGEAPVAQIGHDRMAKTSNPRARTDEGNGSRLEEIFEMSGGHGETFRCMRPSHAFAR